MIHIKDFFERLKFMGVKFILLLILRYEKTSISNRINPEAVVKFNKTT